jgi:hypothetical protein
MSDLLAFVIDRHGSTDRWHHASAVSAAVHVDGGIWAFRGQPGRLVVERLTAAGLDHWRDPLETSHAEQGRQHA